MNNTIIWSGIIVVMLMGGVWWSQSRQANDPDIITRNGLHWHPELTILVKGEKQVIPANIGIGPSYAANPTFDRGMGMTAVHTHDDASQGIIHFEFSGVVRREDTELENFFAIWDKDLYFFGENVSMTVNGESNTQFGDYEMRDGDKIVLIYE